MEAAARRGRKRPSTELVSPREFLQSWNLEAFQATNLPRGMEEAEMMGQISKMMCVSEETVQELAEVCGKSTLLTGKEPDYPADLLEMTKVPPGINLESVKFQEQHQKVRRENDAHKVADHKHMKYNMMDDYMAVMPESVLEAAVPIEFKVPVPNALLTVQITKCLQHGESLQRYREWESIGVLSTQSLSDLRDKITCSSDAVIPGDYSSLPDTDSLTLEKAGDMYKSSFFFIENVFYNDLRLPDNKDYSKVIVKWAEKYMPNSRFTTADMDKTSFLDLKVKLGHHYLFLHQGSCEHSVLFTDIRLLHSKDVQDIRYYPILLISRLKNRSVCQGCFKFSSKWIVRNTPQIPTDPCYLCKVCFKSLLYDKNGQKRSNFKAYHLSEFYSKEGLDQLTQE